MRYVRELLMRKRFGALSGLNMKTELYRRSCAPLIVAVSCVQVGEKLGKFYQELKSRQPMVPLIFLVVF